MARTRGPRIGNFKGSEADYSEYLERLVKQLQAQVCHLHQQVGHRHTVPIPSQPSTQQPIQSQPSTAQVVQSQPLTPIRSQPSTAQAVQSQPLTEQLLGSLTFQLETPESQAKKATKPSIEPWRALIDGFLSQVPKDEDSWSAKRKQTYLHNQEAVIHTFCLLTCRSPRVRSLLIGDAPSDEASILALLEQYGGFTLSLAAHKAYTTQISYYSTLLFVCLAIVALKTGSDVEAVDGHMKKFLSEQQGKECTSGATYLSRLRTAALWPVRRMDELYEQGLKHRGPEIFVLCGQSIHSYKKFAQCQGTEKFSTEVVVCEPPEGELQADLPFYIPFLIKIILGDRCSLGQINKALGTQLRDERFNEWAYAAWRRMESLLRIESPLRARKRRRVTLDNEVCEGRDDSFTETRPAAADSTQDDLGGIVSRLQSLVEMENGHVVQSQGSPPGPVPLSDVSTGAPHGEAAVLTTIDLHPNVLFAGQPSVRTVANNPNLTVDSYIVTHADDPTFITNWQLQTIHERSATDASGILSSEPQIDNMPSVSMAVQKDVETSVLNQPFQAVDAGMHVNGYMQGQLAATPQAQFNDSDGPPVVQISVDTNEQTVSDVYDDGPSLDMWAAPRISDALFAPNPRYWDTDRIRHYDILYPPSVAAYPDTFDAAPRISL